MSAWSRAVYDLGFGVAMMLVAFNVRNCAWRLHGYVASRPRVGVVLTPTVLRAAGAVLGVTGTTIGTVRLFVAVSG
ncbi:hypothetical protein ACFV0T_24865 [Streptomyces sp. NPDC059582]|uniref:hypothetical protein n=1 Tax=Streptomyces sp. NPDC059582 TaxID=3346875 RepID=UPI0036C17C5E